MGKALDILGARADEIRVRRGEPPRRNKGKLPTLSRSSLKSEPAKEQKETPESDDMLPEVRRLTDTLGGMWAQLGELTKAAKKISRPAPQPVAYEAVISRNAKGEMTSVRLDPVTEEDDD